LAQESAEGSGKDFHFSRQHLTKDIGKMLEKWLNLLCCRRMILQGVWLASQRV
jgi:DNA-directed RNA polymerase subunit N (RpoN/RPB10)